MTFEPPNSDDFQNGADSMVYEARGQNPEAAQCYRKVVEFMRAHSADFDPELQTHFLERIAKLDPSVAAD